jgi:hypothetical protein
MSMHLEGKNVALIVHSCDRYQSLYKGFEFFFLKYWDFSINCNYYFATEEKEVTISGFKNIRSGKGEWADRLAFLLKEEISEEYVLYFQEDMWLSKKVNSNFFNQLFELTLKSNWQQVKLHSSELYRTTATDLFIEGFNIAKIDNGNSDFLMSHQVTLWKKDFLLRQLHKNEHPWRNERKGTKRLKKLDYEIYQADYFAENGKNEINKNDHPVLRSEYRTISINAVLNSNIEPYIKELMNEDIGHQEYALKLEHNYRNNLTHDGKPKPRKVDIFKRVKRWLRKA